MINLIEITNKQTIYILSLENEVKLTCIENIYQGSIRIKNFHNLNQAIFRVRVSAANNYKVKPITGLLYPNDQIEVKIYTKSDINITECMKDKFQIQGYHADDFGNNGLKPEPKIITEYFHKIENMRKNEIQSITLNIKLLDSTYNNNIPNQNDFPAYTINNNNNNANGGYVGYLNSNRPTDKSIISFFDSNPTWLTSIDRSSIGNSEVNSFHSGINSYSSLINKSERNTANINDIYDNNSNMESNGNNNNPIIINGSSSKTERMSINNDHLSSNSSVTKRRKIIFDKKSIAKQINLKSSSPPQHTNPPLMGISSNPNPNLNNHQISTSKGQVHDQEQDREYLQKLTILKDKYAYNQKQINMITEQNNKYIKDLNKLKGSTSSSPISTSTSSISASISNQSQIKKTLFQKISCRISNIEKWQMLLISAFFLVFGSIISS